MSKKFTITDENILIREITNTNDWCRISKLYELTKEQLIAYIDKINWPYYICNHNNIPNDILDKVIQNKMKLTNRSSYWYYISLSITEIWFIKKYIKYLKDELKNIAIRLKLKPKEYIEIFGKPQVGDGATMHNGYNKFPYTIIKVNKTGTNIKVQEDNIKVYNKFMDNAYVIEPNKDGKIIEISLRKDLQWKEVNGTTKFIIGSKTYR